MANWCVDHDGRRHLVLYVYGGRDVDGCECFAIELTTAFAVILLDRIRQLRDDRAMDRALHTSSYWCHHGDYYGLDDERLASTPTDSDTLIPRWPREYGDADTDTHALSVTEDEVYWTAQLTHAEHPVLLSTEALPASALQHFVAGRDPWPHASPTARKHPP